MGTLNKGASNLQTAFAVFALSFGVVACGDDDSSNKDGGIVITLPDGGTKPLDSGVGLDSGFVGTTDGGGDAGPVVTQPTTCVVTAGCTCTPTTNLEFLNSCTTSACIPFDNSTRLPAFAGTLPPLQ